MHWHRDPARALEAAVCWPERLTRLFWRWVEGSGRYQLAALSECEPLMSSRGFAQLAARWAEFWWEQWGGLHPSHHRAPVPLID